MFIFLLSDYATIRRPLKLHKWHIPSFLVSPWNNDKNGKGITKKWMGGDNEDRQNTPGKIALVVVASCKHGTPRQLQELRRYTYIQGSWPPHPRFKLARQERHSEAREGPT